MNPAVTAAYIQVFTFEAKGTWWLSGRVFDSGLRGCRFEPQWRHCVVSLSNTLSVLVQPRKTSPDMTEKLLTGM